VKSTWSSAIQAKPVSVGGRRRAPRETGSWNKASRFVLNLSDPQIVELVRQVHEAERRGPDIDAEALRMTIATFLRRPPKC
jgi:hypothetical protein